MGYVMDHMVPREKDSTIDLECGGTTSEEEGNKDSCSDSRQEKNLFGRVWGGIVNLDGFPKDEEGVRSFNNVSNSGEVSDDAESLIDKSSGGEENIALLVKKREKEKRKKTSSRKAPKPPRPPRGPSLDAADQKLIKEISELAMLKRARVERMKAQKKKKKPAKTSSSSNSNLCAMIVTILFILVIIFQGMLSSSDSSFEGSPGSSAASRVPFISVQFYKNLDTASSDEPGSVSPNFVEQVSGSRPEDRRGTGPG